ncbi:hypothetical protein A1F94_001656 [Pyrenophora tritici-repentis]|uniref:Uncharacterized protein n=1 Tax=Pyrenophora tritici-repentis TaxID=45151 RepID=A0A2W1F688_9PLEO|nr:hypothetical protein PtrV1_02256 [Pyrenophora tritici-repentis]KAF7455006.1 hypothetical protein A1F99_022640 [Pyrenophora tritici-repentis]KAF7578158.1 hypothetical protein PtrM4_023980 [Pyrenophora tritici-repentis]KAG9388763.1 hypothetical protein A1F94_001656 [Pyrenophora tritici-repentis]KAI0577651.1 hypothetical protein Alg215_06803 [Pyrenophora tritici-repentis]
MAAPSPERTSRGPQDQVAPYSPKSRFFDLPAEIRNEIYSYVFTFSDGVRVSSSLKFCLLDLQPGAIESGGAHLVEANALNYTCRQLHFETKSLLPKYTTSFTFKPSAGDEDGLKTFLAFARVLRSETPIRRSMHIYPRHHCLTSEPYRSPFVALMMMIGTGDFNDLAFFCHQNPSIAVLLHYPAPILRLEILRIEFFRLDRIMHILRTCLLSALQGSLEWQVKHVRSQGPQLPLTRIKVPLNLRVTLDLEQGFTAACVTCTDLGMPWSECECAAETAALVEWYKDRNW